MKRQVIPETSAAFDSTRVVERPDGFYWRAIGDGRESGPFATLVEAVASMQLEEDAALEPGTEHLVGFGFRQRIARGQLPFEHLEASLRRVDSSCRASGHPLPEHVFGSLARHDRERHARPGSDPAKQVAVPGVQKGRIHNDRKACVDRTPRNLA